jgi:hypothetical protein
VCPTAGEHFNGAVNGSAVQEYCREFKHRKKSPQSIAYPTKNIFKILIKRIKYA